MQNMPHPHYPSIGHDWLKPAAPVSSGRDLPITAEKGKGGQDLFYLLEGTKCTCIALNFIKLVFNIPLKIL